MADSSAALGSFFSKKKGRGKGKKKTTGKKKKAVEAEAAGEIPTALKPRTSKASEDSNWVQVKEERYTPINHTWDISAR